MKRFNIFATMALAMVLGLGAAIGISSGAKEARSAEAASITGKTTIYLDISNYTWVKPWINFRVGASSWKKAKMVATTTANLYYYTVDSNTQIIQFDHDDYWDESNCYTAQLSPYSGDKGLCNAFKLTGRGTNLTGNWYYYTGHYYTVKYNSNGGSGTVSSDVAYLDNATAKNTGFTRNGYELSAWNTKSDGSGTTISLGGNMTYANCLTYESGAEVTLYAQWASTTSNTFRLWFYRNGHYQDGFIWKIWDGVSGHAAYEPKYIETYSGSGNYLLYYDLPTSVTKINFQIFDNAGQYQDAVDQINYSDGQNAYLWTADVSTWNTIHKDERLNNLKASPSTIATALSAYYSCSSDANNGYGNAAQLYKTWVYTGTTSCVQGTTSEAQARNAIANVYMEDYSEQSYTDPSKRTQQVTLLEKLTMMMNNQNPVNSRIHLFLFGKDAKTNNSVIIVIVSSLVTIGAFAGYFFYKKKKEDR